ncbi:MAG: NADPH cytochrome P450 oxidoreductase family protein [Cardiobacterium sp.]
MNPTLAYTLIAAQTLYWLYYLWQRRPRTASDDSALLLLYASQGGQAETLANHLADGLNTRAQSLDAWHARHPVKALAGKTLILIASTTGDGDPPDNAIRFSRSLKKTGAALTDTRYHLLALGDKRYPHYCAYGYHLDSELQRLGAERESPVTTVDNLDPQTIAYWQKQLGEHLHTALDVPAQPPAARAVLVSRSRLNPDSEQPLYHLRLDCPALAADTALIEITIPHGKDELRRQYSVAGIAPDGSRGLDLIIRLQTHADGTPGAGSHYLTETLQPGGEVKVRALTHHPAELPDAPRPLILIASGSGLAGILGILARMEARYPARAHGLQHWLIYGERDPDHDRIYTACLEKYQEDGILTWLDRPYSRGATREYAQHRLAAQRDRLHAQLDAGAVIYICGSADKIGAGALDTLHELLGAKTCDRLGKAGRIRLDTY